MATRSPERDPNRIRMTLRKTVALLLAAAMVFCAFGCTKRGGDGPGSPTNPGGDPANTDPSGPATAGPQPLTLAVTYEIETRIVDGETCVDLIRPVLSVPEESVKLCPALETAIDEWNRETAKALRKTFVRSPSTVKATVLLAAADVSNVTIVLKTETLPAESVSEPLYSAVIVDPANGTMKDDSYIASDEKSLREAILSLLGDAEKTGVADRLIRDDATASALETIAGLSLHERLCQLFIVLPQHLSGSLTSYGEDLIQGLEEYPVGGVLFVANNFAGAENTLNMTRVIAEHSKILPFLSVDEEGGRVARLSGKPNTVKLEPMYSYRALGTGVAYENARTLAYNLHAYGFNLDFAPVADIWSNPKNTVIGDRAYSDDPEQAAELVAAAVKGFRNAGVFCCVKHFPGHGDTAQDSHTGAALVTKTLDELRTAEFLPFRSGIEAGADMVMIGHLTCPALDDVPASVSKKIVTGLLREELGYDGVVLTDSLHMGAVAMNDPAELALAAFEAGSDILLSSDDFKASIEAFRTALTNGTITTDRLNESLVRILRLKQR